MGTKETVEEMIGKHDAGVVEKTTKKTIYDKKQATTAKEIVDNILWGENMPRFDKKGPRGLGPKTGRGLGYCPPEDVEIEKIEEESIAEKIIKKIL